MLGENNTELLPIRDLKIDEVDFQMSLWLIDQARQFPQAFKLLPVGSETPTEPGTWVAYPYDDKLQIVINSSHNEGIEFFKQYKLKQREADMSRALTVQEKKTVLQLLSANMKAVAAVVPKHLTPERLMRVAFQAIVKTPKLAQCTQLSLVNAIIEASQLGLEISGPLGQASLIPFKDEAVLIVEYKGKIALAHNSGQIKSFSAHPVYEKDVWDYEYGLNPYLKHRPYDEEDDRGDLVAAYAVVQYKNGGVDFEVVNRKMAMRSKAASKAGKKEDSPWNQPANEWTMWVKTAVHQLAKRIPQSPELQRANTLDDQAESGQDLNHIIDIELQDLPKTMGVDDAKTQAKLQQSPPKAETGDEKIMANLRVGREEFPGEYNEACKHLKLNPADDHSPIDATAIMQSMNSLMDGGGAS